MRHPARLLPALLAALAFAGCGSSEDSAAPPPRSSPEDGGATATPSATATNRPQKPQVDVVATGLEVPWQIAFFDDGSALITERGGRVRLLSGDGDLREEPVAEIEVNPAGEGGLMGMAVRGDDVWLYMTRGSENIVARYRYADGGLSGEKVILDGIDAATIHDGGRMHFGPDGMLYLTTGDAANPSVAQDPDALNGKFLRVDPDSGEAEIYSLGHRNPQGFDWEPGTGRLISDEHGPSGDDEVNVVRKGANYGWPDVQGDESRDGIVSPIKLYQSPAAPSGGSFLESEGSGWTGSYFIAMLRGERLQRIRIDGDEVVEDEPLFEGEFGRLREVVEGPDGNLYVLTSNRDGRGNPSAEDDRIIRITPPAP